MIIFIGDVHGEFEELAHRLAVRKIKDSVLIQVGDFGLGFLNESEEEVKIKRLSKILKGMNNVLYVIRGNHDDPSYFEKETKIGNIILLPDYSTLSCNGQTLLLAGGAISIDRKARIQGRDYWDGEGFRFDELKLATSILAIQKVDIVVTHSAPTEFWPFSFSSLVHAYAGGDSNLISDLAVEREQHSRLLEFVESKLTASHWYYGHFHTSIDGRYNNIKYYALGESEILEHTSTV